MFLDSGQSDLSLDFRFSATTAVSVVSLWARQQGSAVTLGWVTAAESNTAGFHVARAPNAAGPFTRLTATPLLRQGVSGGGATYRWVDRTIQAECIAWYRLVTAPNGVVIGPVAAERAGTRVYLPMLLRDR